MSYALIIASRYGKAIISVFFTWCSHDSHVIKVTHDELAYTLSSHDEHTHTHTHTHTFRCAYRLLCVSNNKQRVLMYLI